MALNIDPTVQAEIRGRSTIEFPYLDLDDAVQIAKTMKERAGTSCLREQLAGYLGVSPTGGGFNLRLGTAKMFGVVTYERGGIELTPLGIRIVDAQQERAARVEAFLKIPLYSKLYDKFKSTSLPPAQGLEEQIASLGVAPKQKDKARQVFLRSAKQAGFFEVANDRLILPALGIVPTLKIEEAAQGKIPEPIKQQQQPPIYPYFIQGLLEKLPPEGATWPKEERKRWLNLAELAFDVMYRDGEKAQVK
ncbi:MAG TPA: hypothetical protein VNW47_08275 [Terriglobales bacterium]|jgi:hypothetical protein|nr:hypothetical protein [Terriglobales bacterium]